MPLGSSGGIRNLGQTRGEGGALAHRVDPVHVGADSGKDSGLLGVVAAEAGTEADDAVDLPASLTVLAVQGTARVALFSVKSSLKMSTSVELRRYGSCFPFAAFG